MRIIITGATGFLGFELFCELLESGNEVIVVCRPDSRKIGKLNTYLSIHPEIQKQVQIREIAFSELGKLDIHADVFFHLAWNGSSGADREDFDMQMKNVQYMSDVLYTAKHCGCQRVICAGSQAEYGVVHSLAREEETVPHPFMMYGAAKLAAYEMGQVLAKQLGITLIWPRIYSVYGVGENPGTLVNYVMDSLIKGEIPQLSPCENMWNFLYVSDCAKRLINLAKNQDANAGIYHIASEDTRLLKDFVSEIRDIVAPGMELGFGARESNPERTFWLNPDTTKIRELSGPCEVSFAEGIRRKLEEFRKE